MELVFRDVQVSFRKYAWVNLRLTGKLLWRPRLWLLLGCLAVLLLMFMGRGPAPTSSPGPHAPSPLDYLPIALPFTFLVVLPFALWRAWRRNYQTARLLHEPATYRFTEAGLQVDSPYQQAQIAWVNFTTAHKQSPYAVLLTSSVSGIFLDFRCLEAPATEADFRALLARHRVTLK